MLRIEVVVHNTQQLRCGHSLEKFPQILLQAKDILERFMDALSCIDQCFIADSMLDRNVHQAVFSGQRHRWFSSFFG